MMELHFEQSGDYWYVRNDKNNRLATIGIISGEYLVAFRSYFEHGASALRQIADFVEKLNRQPTNNKRG
jgi:hypothetical protein